MLTKENVLFSVADHPTPKIDDSGIGYTLNSRDYKDAQCVVTRVFDSHRAHEFKEYTEVCESVLAHYGTGGAIHLWFWKTENLCCLKAHILTQQLMRTA